MQLKTGTYLQNGKYRVISTLGQGGFGITYLAEQVMAKRNVCIKEFFPKEYYNRDSDSMHISLGSEGNAEMMNAYKAKFIKEAQTIANLNHPNIIRIFDVFEENNTAYYAMEYIDGESLNAKVKREGALAEDMAVKHIRDVASALDYIHKRNIMHLDVKPANVMLRKEDDSAILIDFGLSKQYDAAGDQTSSTPVGISHGYAPIEQYQSGGVSTFSPVTDIYSLGATLLFAVTGRVPAEAATIGEEGVGEMPVNVSRGVQNAIIKSMKYWRKHRPQSIKEFIAIINYTEDEQETKPLITSSQKQNNKKTFNVNYIWVILITAIVVGVCAYLLFNGEDKETSSSIKEIIIEEKKETNSSIYYTAANKLELNISHPFINVSHEFDSATGSGVITIDGNITKIGPKTFSGRSDLTGITIPEGVAIIDAEAFANCYNLTSVTIPESVTTIGDNAFAYCSRLTNITIPESVTAIGTRVFANCSQLQEITIPGSVTVIKSETFTNCSSLHTVNIELGVTTIEINAFNGCKALGTISIPESVTDINYDAFTGCVNLPTYDGIRYADTYLIGVTDKNTTQLRIKEGTRLIRAHAFDDCDDIKNVNLPNSVTSIGDYAFAYCDKLEDIYIPEGVTYIGHHAFYYCINLRKVILPEGITAIGAYTFYSCDRLTSVTIPDSVTEIGGRAFYDCDNLKSATIPDSVTEIGEWAFYNCYRLTSVTIPDSVTKIKEYAFYSCDNLTEVYCKAIIPPDASTKLDGVESIISVSGEIFKGHNNSLKIYVPRESVDAYKSAMGWEEYADVIVGYDF